MVQLIGLKRLILLGVAIALNIVFASVFFLWVEPMRVDHSKKLRSIDSSIRKLRNDISGIKKEMQELQNNIKYFEGLERYGFFKTHDRFTLQKEVEKLQDNTSVVGYTYTIDELQRIPEKTVEKAKHELLNSRISLEGIKAYSDRDVYQLVHQISTQFPGQTRIHSLEIDKKPIDNRLLSAIRGGKKDAPISASIVFDWQTMVRPAGSDASDGFGNYFK